MIPLDKCTRYTPGPPESAIILMQAERSVIAFRYPKGVQQAWAIGWTDTLADASSPMLDDARGNGRGNGVPYALWRWTAGGNNVIDAGVHHRTATGNILQYDICRVEVKA
jgi:hypothetical protein